MSQWVNIPNLLTVLRLALAPLVIQAILEGRHLLALAIFAAAAFTDYLDGAAARRFGVATSTGAYLDPIADKCLLSGVFLALGAASIVPWWFVAVVFGRDLYLLLAVAAMLALTKIKKFPPSRWGKISTFVQIACALTWMTRNIYPGTALDSVASAMLWVSTAFTVW